MDQVPIGYHLAVCQQLNSASKTMLTVCTGSGQVLPYYNDGQSPWGSCLVWCLCGWSSLCVHTQFCWSSEDERKVIVNDFTVLPTLIVKSQSYWNTSHMLSVSPTISLKQNFHWGYFQCFPDTDFNIAESQCIHQYGWHHQLRPAWVWRGTHILPHSCEPKPSEPIISELIIKNTDLSHVWDEPLTDRYFRRLYKKVCVCVRELPGLQAWGPSSWWSGASRS